MLILLGKLYPILLFIIHAKTDQSIDLLLTLHLCLLLLMIAAFLSGYFTDHDLHGSVHVRISQLDSVFYFGILWPCLVSR